MHLGQSSATGTCTALSPAVKCGPSRRTRLLVACALAALPFAPSLAQAQAVTGTVTDRAGVVLPGITVVLVDEAGVPHAAALSDASGRFAVRAPGAGRYQLRMEAVGVFSERTEPVSLVDGQTIVRPIVFEMRARSLSAITIKGRSRCQTNPEGSTAVAILWDEVRKALAVTQLTADAGAFRFDLVEYERELDPRSKAVRRSRRWERPAVTGQPYESIPADSLARHGFVRTANDGTWYYAPDARTLLSDAFLRTHCLAAIESRGDDGLLGLAFEPTNERGIPDVKGTLWLDAATSRLRTLEYRYTGLPRSVRDYELGGRVEFERLPLGAWIVRHWYIRMPRLSRQVRSMPSGVPDAGPARLVPVTVEAVIGLVERGGDVTVHASDLALQPPRFANISGAAFDSTQGGALRGAEVWLDAAGTPVPAGRTVTDSQGTFRIDSLAAGAYTLTMTHPRLDTLGTSLAPVELTLAAGQSVSVTLSTASVPTMIRALCAGAPDGSRVVRGRVLRGTTGPPVPGAGVRASWAAAGDSGVPPARSERVASADDAGHFTLCDLPDSASLVLRASDARSRGEPMQLAPGTERLTSLVLLAPEHAAGISGTVTGRDGRPLGNAEVRIVDADVAVRTDARGAYRVSKLAAGTHLVEARAIGHAPARLLVALDSGVVARANMKLAAVATLRPVKSVAAADRYRTGFGARRARNAGGHFLTSEAIRKSGQTRVTELLRQVPGLRIRKVGSIAILEFGGRGARSFSAHGCPVAYVVDGVPYELTAFGLDGELLVENIEAIEVYDAATAPIEYSGRGTGCGVILIWTRERAIHEGEAAGDSSATTPDGPKRRPR